MASWNIAVKPRLYYFLLLLMYSAQVGVFLCQDLLLFFLMWEVELVPVYLLISIWGGAKRMYAATKFILYTAIGSIFILVAALAMAFYGDIVSFNFTDLALKEYSLPFQVLAYLPLSSLPLASSCPSSPCTPGCLTPTAKRPQPCP
jgi:NAD(P)H-quinone oxidoreductase subunit 4